ncbi:CsbD family protein, partial [Streptomyces sp. NPDC005349]|uniref:CsbD family protein n=1 Tax=Streptomyces sp. NPDC005349 TaxID=3157037 RepID=UPI0033A47D48
TDKVKGKAKEMTGKVTGNRGKEAEGRADQAKSGRNRRVTGLHRVTGALTVHSAMSHARHIGAGYN